MWEYLTCHVIQRHSGRLRQQSLWFCHIRPPAKPRSASPQIIWRAALEVWVWRPKSCSCARARHHRRGPRMSKYDTPSSLTHSFTNWLSKKYFYNKKTWISWIFENRDLSRTNENRNIHKMMLDSKPEIYKPENFIKTIPEKVNTETQI